jgi:cyanophycinase
VAASTPGPLILVGGAEFLPGNEAQDAIWADAADGRPAYVVATAAVRQDPDRAVATARRWFSARGVRVTELRIRGRRDAADPKTVAAAREGGAFYLCGGDPGLVVELLAGTAAWHAIVAAWSDGAALAGSSAGAMAMGEWTPIRAGRSHDRRRFAPALSVVPKLAVVPHLDEFGERWLRTLGPPREDGVLLGLDTRTAAVWRPRIGWRAVGPGRVAVVGSGGRLERTDGGRLPGVARPAVRVRTA